MLGSEYILWLNLLINWFVYVVGLTFMWAYGIIAKRKKGICIPGMAIVIILCRKLI
jgi:hypothetical protein